MNNAFGEALRQWRNQRRISQLDLGLAATTVLSLLSTIAQFGSAEDIALSELKIEMMFPADEATRNLLLGMSGQSH